MLNRNQPPSRQKNKFGKTKLQLSALHLGGPEEKFGTLVSIPSWCLCPLRAKLARPETNRTNAQEKMNIPKGNV